jgi:hypothetical protein
MTQDTTPTERALTADRERIVAFAKALFKEVPLCNGCDFDHGWDDHVIAVWNGADAERAARAPEGERAKDLAYVEQAYEQHKQGKLGPTGVSAALLHAIHGMRAARAEPGLDVDRLLDSLDRPAAPDSEWLDESIRLARAALEAHGEPQEGKR